MHLHAAHLPLAMEGSEGDLPHRTTADKGQPHNMTKKDANKNVTIALAWIWFEAFAYVTVFLSEACF